MIDKYNIQTLKKELGELGYVFYYFRETDSAMNIIHKHALKGAQDKVIALTDHQTQGIGRKGRVWMDTPSCSLMFSMLFYIPQAMVAAFADLVALTVCQALKTETGLSSIQIKYPNDLVINDKKFGGILVKNIYDEKINYLGTNVGIGINVHYSQKELKKFLVDYTATSLDVEKGSTVNREKLLIEIAKALQYLETETRVISQNPKALESFDKKWTDASSVFGRELAILKDDRIIDKGKVIATGIGRGIELQTSIGKKWFSLFETDMKARLIN